MITNHKFPLSQPQCDSKLYNSYRAQGIFGLAKTIVDQANCTKAADLRFLRAVGLMKEISLA
jgi:hypothetical protein